MIEIDVKLKRVEVTGFNRTRNVVMLCLFYNDGEDSKYEMSYIPQSAESAAKDIMVSIRDHEKQTRKGDIDYRDPLSGVVHVNFVDEEKTLKTLASFMTTINDKLYYLKKSSTASDHMTLVRTLQNLRVDFT